MQRDVRTGVQTDRRAHPRFIAFQLRGLRTARVKYGEDVTIIDLSAGGVSFEADVALKPDLTLVLEFAAAIKTVLVPSRVVRCENLPTIDNSVRATGACAFKRPIAVKDLVGESPRPGQSAQPDARFGATVNPWQQVVGKYRDGRLVRGYTNDFSASRTHLNVTPRPSAHNTTRVALTDLEALFFLRDTHTTGTNGGVVAGHNAGTPQGRRVAMALPNGTELIGTTLNFRRDGSGFFIYPADAHSAAVRVFITPSGIRTIKFL